MGQLALENESHGLEATMGMRAEGQATIARPVGLRPVMVEEEKRIDLLEARAGQRPPRDEIADVVAVRGMEGDDGAGGHGAILERAYAPQIAPAPALRKRPGRKARS